MSARPAAAMRVCAVRSRARLKLRTCPHFGVRFRKHLIQRTKFVLKMRTSFVEIRTSLLMVPADANL
eukprot:3532885-Pleurochrysis_carterae.AAC.1